VCGRDSAIDGRHIFCGIAGWRIDIEDHDNVLANPNVCVSAQSRASSSPERLQCAHCESRLFWGGRRQSGGVQMCGARNLQKRRCRKGRLPIRVFETGLASVSLEVMSIGAFSSAVSA
ncbi:MAG: hypothetical protein ACJ8C6_12695, partial [Microvirga sp.]